MAQQTDTIVIEGLQCPHCGKVMAAGALAGLCPACLFAQGAVGEERFSAPSLDEIRKLFTELEIVALLGAGGMGAVYKARQPALDRWVALKVLPAREEPSFAERFNREARALARLSHPNIVAVHEFGKAESLHFFIMEFVDGANLRQLEQAGTLSSREALQIIPQICDALQYAHDEGVVHRDIKPENVLVDRKGRVKIADFGLAKIIGSAAGDLRLTAEGQVMGTPHYMAPEQVERPLSVDHRADIYSLGVVFYEMLTGDLPLGKFAPPSRKVLVDVRLDEVVLRALENNPEHRFQRASEVKQQVETISETPQPSKPAAISRPAGRYHDFGGFPVVIERGTTRALNRKAIFAAFALMFGLLSLAFAFVSAVTGRSVLGVIGIVGWQSLVMRLLLGAAITIIAVWIRFRRPWPTGAYGTALVHPRKPWYRNRRVIVTAVVLLVLTWGVFHEQFWFAPIKRWFARPAIQAAQAATLDPATHTARAVLPGGGTVELLAIGNPDADGQGWWGTDGTWLGNTGFEVPNPVENASTGRKSKDVLFRVRNLPAGASSAAYRAEPESGCGSGGSVFVHGWPMEGGSQARFAWPEPVRKADLRVGFGLAPWQTIATANADGNRQTQTRAAGGPFWNVTFHGQPSDSPEGAQVALIFGPESPMWLSQVVAVDTNGVEHGARSAQGTPIEKVMLWTHTFAGMKLKALREFRVQVRPVHWVEFPNVALAPKSPVPSPKQKAFGATIERTFSGAIDFDSGTVTNFQAATAPNSDAALESQRQSLRRKGFDAIWTGTELEPLDMNMIGVRTNDWESIEARSLLQLAYQNFSRPSTLALGAPGHPVLFGFRTAGHQVGLVEFVRGGGNEPGITARYKLVEQGR